MILRRSSKILERCCLSYRPLMLAAKLRPSINNTITSAQYRRPFSQSAIHPHKHVEPPKPGEELKVTFVSPDGEETTLQVAEGDSLLDIAHEHDIELEGACEGSVACSTCHVIVDEPFYDKLTEPSDEENDMLDLAFALTDTSRLGCQVIMKKELDGLRVTLPSATRNIQSSNYGKS